MNINKSFDRFYQVSKMYEESCLLGAAAELDVFTTILGHENRLSAHDLAVILKTDLRGMTVLLDALAATGYLLKGSDAPDTEAVYFVAEEFRELLDRRHPATFIPMIRHLACVQRAWSHLAQTVKTGTPTEIPPSILGADEDRRSFILAMNSVAWTLAEPTIELLRKVGLLVFDHFIDVGGASGTYTKAFLQMLPKSRGTIFDLPVGIAEARKRFAGTEFENRVTLVEGDFYQNELPAGFDFAWISAIIHQFDRGRSQELYRKTFKALDSGGTVAVRDFMMNADSTQPRDGALFGVSMLVETKTGRVYTFDEVKADLESAGFTDVKFAIPAETMSAVVTAKKP
jgi:hypothetical protein